MNQAEVQKNAQILKTYAEYESQIAVRHLKFGCYLVMLLMPVGVVLDYFVYPGQARFFLELRLLCTLLAGVLWGLLLHPVSQKLHRLLSLIIALLPASFICWMIYASEGFDSPYYAGLNLVLLCIALIMRWTVGLSVMASLSTIAMYLAACFFHAAASPAQYGVIVNNLYFLVLTGGVVIAGGRLHQALRIREFSARHELDERKRELEEAIRKLTEAEAQLVQQEKMASLGVMSAGIIHEINNPLNFASTGLYTLRNKGKHLAPEQQEEYADILKDVEEGITRVKTIVSDLRMFTHPDTESRDEVEVPEVVTSALRFLSNEWRDKVQIKQDIPEHQTIWANKNKLIHVLVNLLQNSLDALNSKQEFNGEAPTIWIKGLVEHGQTKLIVRDNGPGIEPKHLDKIFDPFYTTKDVGEGMGLGLSICYRIVQECDGRIAVKTDPGKFCEFTLEFPAKA